MKGDSKGATDTWDFTSAPKCYIAPSHGTAVGFATAPMAFATAELQYQNNDGRIHPCALVWHSYGSNRGAATYTPRQSPESALARGAAGEGAADVTPRVCASTRGSGAAVLHAPRVRRSPLDGMIQSLRK